MRTLRCSAVAIMALLVVVLAGGRPADAAEPGAESQFVAGLNAVRANNGLPPLAVDGELTAVARSWADQHGRAGTPSRTTPTWAARSAQPGRKLGENVGAGPDVGGSWTPSSTARATSHNIVDADFDYVGVGVTWGADGRMYTTHVFMDLDGGALAAAARHRPRPDPSAGTRRRGAHAHGRRRAAAEPPPPPAPVAPPAAAAPRARSPPCSRCVGALDAGVP